MDILQIIIEYPFIRCNNIDNECRKTVDSSSVPNRVRTLYVGGDMKIQLAI